MERNKYKPEDYVIATRWENRVESVCCTYNGWTLIKRGKGTGVPLKFDEFGEEETGFDFLFQLPDGRRVWVEVTGDKQHTWEDSRFFPIQPLKVKRAEALSEETYIIYYLDRDNSCFWLPLKECGKFPIEHIQTKKGPQVKHIIPKENWNPQKEGFGTLGFIKSNWGYSLQDLCESVMGVVT